jgi:hypothetical protein
MSANLGHYSWVRLPPAVKSCWNVLRQAMIRNAARGFSSCVDSAPSLFVACDGAKMLHQGSKGLGFLCFER